MSQPAVPLNWPLLCLKDLGPFEFSKFIQQNTLDEINLTLKKTKTRKNPLILLNKTASSIHLMQTHASHQQIPKQPKLVAQKSCQTDPIAESEPNVLRNRCDSDRVQMGEKRKYGESDFMTGKEKLARRILIDLNYFDVRDLLPLFAILFPIICH